MGNSVACFYPKEISKRARKRPPRSDSTSGRARAESSSSSQEKERLDDSLIRQQALAAALLFQHHQKNGSLPAFNRSTSVVYPDKALKKQNVPRSSSTRPRSTTDTLLRPHQLVTQDFIGDILEDQDGFTLGVVGALAPIAILKKLEDLKIDGLETNHFVLVHGGGFGAWSWYKTIALLEEGGFEVDAIDLTGSGIHSFDTNSITSLAQYVKPLTDFLEKLEQGKKVILVGHDFGGACVSYAMELFPSKVAKAVFIAAAMLTSGQSTLDMFSKQTGSNDLMRRAQIFLYGNGKDHPPTAIDLDKALLRELLFNQSPAKDVALASVSMRPMPIAPVLEKLCLSDVNYGSVRRFYIETQEDCAISVALQETFINSNPPEKVFQIKGSDHSPFFSRPQSLHRLLVEISKIP